MPNYRIKLTESEVTALRFEYWTHGTTQKELSAKYGVSPSQVSQIIRRKSWPYLPRVINEYSRG